jgi:tRNA(Ile)-lysidine synthase
LSKQQLIDYANELNLSWIDDESNSDVSLDRNYLRHQVLPRLEERWPAYRERIENVIRMLDTPEPSANNVAIDEALKNRLSFDDGLKLVQMDELNEAQTLSLLHAWLLSIGQQVPSRDRLKSIYTNVIKARPDATPEVRIGHGSIRRHGPAIYWVKDMPEVGAAPLVSNGELQSWVGVGQVGIVDVQAGVERFKANLPDLNWRIRGEGETVKPIGRSKSRDLKRLLQEYRVKPWLRYRVPILYSGEKLVAVGDLFIAEQFQAEKDEMGCRVVWQNNVIPD